MKVLSFTDSKGNEYPIEIDARDALPNGLTHLLEWHFHENERLLPIGIFEQPDASFVLDYGLFSAEEHAYFENLVAQNPGLPDQILQEVKAIVRQYRQQLGESTNE